MRELAHARERACTAAGGGDQVFARHLPTEIRIDLARKRIPPTPCRPSSNRELSEPEAARRQDPTTATPLAPSEQDDSGDSAALRQILVEFAPPGNAVPTLREIKAQAEARYVHALLEACAGDARKAARLAGISRGHFYELLRKYA